MADATTLKRDRINQILTLRRSRYRESLLPITSTIRDITDKLGTIRSRMVGKRCDTSLFRNARVGMGCEARYPVEAFHTFHELPAVFQMMTEYPLCKSGNDLVTMRKDINLHLSKVAPSFAYSQYQFGTVPNSKPNLIIRRNPYQLGYPKDFIKNIEDGLWGYQQLVELMHLKQAALDSLQERVCDALMDHPDQHARTQFQRCCMAYQGIIFHAPIQYFKLSLPIAEVIANTYT